MKRFFVVVLLCMCLFTLQASAYSLPYFAYEDGNTVLGTFITSTLTDIQKDDVRTFLDGENNLILYVPFEYENDWFYLVNLEGTTPPPEVEIRADGFIDFYFNTVAVGTVWEIDDSDNITYRHTTTLTPGTSILHAVIIGGKAVRTTNMTLPTPTNTYVADITGALMLRDDGGLMSDVEVDEGEGGGGILGFLSGFWDALKSAFMGLFVPSNGFFTDYFQDIQIVASVKMGGLFSLYNAMLDAFQSLNGDTPSMTFEIPANSMFPSSPLVTFNVLGNVGTYVKWVKGILTGIVVLVTAILCYRRLVTLFEQ